MLLSGPRMMLDLNGIIKFSRVSFKTKTKRMGVFASGVPKRFTMLYTDESRWVKLDFDQSQSFVCLM